MRHCNFISFPGFARFFLQRTSFSYYCCFLSVVFQELTNLFHLCTVFYCVKINCKWHHFRSESKKNILYCFRSCIEWVSDVCQQKRRIKETFFLYTFLSISFLEFWALNNCLKSWTKFYTTYNTWHIGCPESY